MGNIPVTLRRDDDNAVVAQFNLDDTKVYPVAPPPPPPPTSSGNSLNLVDTNNEYLQRTADISFTGEFDLKVTMQGLIQVGTSCPIFANASAGNRVLLTQSGNVSVNIGGSAMVTKVVPGLDIALKNTYRFYRTATNDVYFQVDNETPVFISNNTNTFSLRNIGKATGGSGTIKIKGIVHDFTINGTLYNLSEGTGDTLGSDWKIKSDLGLTHINENVWFVAPPETASIQVINAGVSGNNSYDMLQRYATDVAAHNPDLVFILPGTNDAINSANELTPAAFKSNLLSLVTQTIALGATPVIWNIPPVIDSYKKEDHDYTPIYGDESTFDLNTDVLDGMFRPKVTEVASETGCQVFDVKAVFTANGDPAITLTSYLKNALQVVNDTDGVHFTTAGRQAVAAAMVPFCTGKTKIVVLGDSNIATGGATSIPNNLSLTLNS